VCDMQVKSGFACEEDVKTIKTQITGCVQQLKREREVRRLSVTSVVDSQQPAVSAAASHVPVITSNPATSVIRQFSQEKDGHVDGKLIFTNLFSIWSTVRVHLCPDNNFCMK